MKKIIIALIVCIFSSIGFSQDTDKDGLSDDFEKSIAERFSPEWRYNRQIQNSPIGGSSQNRNEWHYPCSVEWAFQKTKEITGHFPFVVSYYNYNTNPNINLPLFYESEEISNPDNLGSTLIKDPVNQNLSHRSDSPYWNGGDGGNPLLRLQLADDMSGDPEHFPTYFRCNCTQPDELPDGTLHCDLTKQGNKVIIGFLLFHPYDDKNENGFANHAGDWEGVNLLINGSGTSPNNDFISSSSVEEVIFSGHGPNRKAAGVSLEYTESTHPKIYMAWGSHTPYPEPGIFEDYRSPVSPDIYDDFFLGNGLVVQSWRESRQLVQFGEIKHPANGWLNFAGIWGNQDNGSNSSSNSPPYKGGWGHPNSGYYLWEEVKLSKWSENWNNPPLFECKHRPSNWYAEGQPQALLFNNRQWDGNALSINTQFSSQNLPTGPFVAGENIIAINSASSVMLLGGASVKLFDDFNFTGASITLNKSIENLDKVGFEDVVNSVIGVLPTNPNWDGVVCNIPVDWINTCLEPSYPPFKSISIALNLLGNVNYTRGICIRSGVYHDKPTLGLNNQSFVIKAEGGPAIIGKQ